VVFRHRPTLPAVGTWHESHSLRHLARGGAFRAHG
jgi:hypothetical protein